MKTQYIVRSIALQPTTFCNLDCTYCYLPFRETSRKMLPQTTERLAFLINELTDAEIRTPIIIALHAGEPLAIGKAALQSLLNPLEALRSEGKVEYSIQTNATLIDDEWCELFKKYSIHVGISIDGPLLDSTSSRVYRGGLIAQEKILKGVSKLTESKIPFIALSVVDEEMLNHPKDFYDFFLELGCWQLGVNFKEKIGTNLKGICAGDKKVQAFWKHIFELHNKSPQMSIRELRETVPRMLAKGNLVEEFDDNFRDIFPCIKWNGEIVLLSPELLDPSREDAHKFVIGDVYNTSFKTLLRNPEEISYVKDFSRGVSLCKEKCDYFSFCKGGMAANKFYEHGTMETTLTTFCRHSVIDVVDGVLTSLEE